MFHLLVIADPHYSSDPRAAMLPPIQRRRLLGCELTRRAIEDARRVDAVALMGDLIDDAAQPCAACDLACLSRAIETAAGNVPLLVVQGNHDAFGDLVLKAFGAAPGVRELGGYRFVVFIDSYVQDKYATRADTDRRLIRRLGAEGGGPIVVLQHNPMNPAIVSDYPYMLTNRPDVLADYTAAGVLLSLSGHYHPGQPLNESGGVLYYTAPALCEPPFPYAIVTLDGSTVSVQERTLTVPERA